MHFEGAFLDLATNRKLYLHVGFAKCGSTSLQEALKTAPGITYPKNGVHGGEHLALALHLVGLDDWTRQFFSDDWVDENYVGMMNEVRSSSNTVVLSSERLVQLKAQQLKDFASTLPDFDIEIIVVVRNWANYLNSTWRYAVFNASWRNSEIRTLQIEEIGS